MLRFQNLFDQRPCQPQIYNQDASAFPISHSVRQVHRIGISISGRSRGDRSTSRERKPIFSKASNLNCSEGFKEFKSIERKQSNRTDIVQILKPTQEYSIPKMCCQNVLNLMKQQLQLSVSSTQSRMNDQIRKNNEQLIRLQNKIRDNDIILSVKDQEIISLKQKLDKAMISGKLNTEKEMGQTSQNHIDRVIEYLSSRLRDTDNKIKILCLQNTNIGSKEHKIIQNLQRKIDMVSKILIQQLKNKIESLNKKHLQIQDGFRLRVDQISSEVNRLQEKYQSHNVETEERLDLIQQRLIKYKSELDNCLKSSQYLSLNLSKLNSSEFTDLQKIVSNLVHSVKNLEFDRQQVSVYLDQIEAQHYQLIAQVHSQRIELSRKVSQNKNKENCRQQNSVYSNKSVKLVNSKSFEQSSSERVMFPQDQSDVEEYCNNVLKRLTETIRKGKNSLPLHCQIDQTGYLKDSKTGTYVFDVEGNLFQLSKNEISKAIVAKIIKLT